MIEAVVGKRTYSVWMDMLKRLVPHGRTHRLSVVIAGMLQYAEQIAYDKKKANPTARKLSEVFETAHENYVEGDTKDILAITESLLKDSQVRFKRVSSQGSAYSLAEHAVQHYLHWEDMPWEG